jgi:hypothetical protein
MHREIIEVKKENRKRKKMIETQQTLMSANTSNYHQVTFSQFVSTFLDEKGFKIDFKLVCVLLESFPKRKLFAITHGASTRGRQRS